MNKVWTGPPVPDGADNGGVTAAETRAAPPEGEDTRDAAPDAPGASQRLVGKAILTLPYQAPPTTLRGNYSGHWSGRSRATKQLRYEVSLLARQAKLVGPYAHLAVTLVWAPGDRRRRDADNLYPMLKVCCDALSRGRRDWIGLQLVPDDTPQWMDKTPVIAPPPAPKGMRLEIELYQEAQ